MSSNYQLGSRSVRCSAYQYRCSTAPEYGACIQDQICVIVLSYVLCNPIFDAILLNNVFSTCAKHIVLSKVVTSDKSAFKRIL